MPMATSVKGAGHDGFERIDQGREPQGAGADARCRLARGVLGQRADRPAGRRADPGRSPRVAGHLGQQNRTRLAREFHDTLLQTIQGSKMVADDALDEPVDSSRMHRALEKLSTWMGQATQEGRAALNSLRASTTQRNDLADAFRRATEDDLIPSSMSVAISVVGIPGEMHPIVRDEICRIGYEAIRNASLHSRASQLDVELSYTQDLMLRVKDKGVGIDPGFLDKGKDGHYGLQGMRERSARIGGKLSLFSSAASGTEIRLVVPGNIIFRAATPVRDLAYQDRNLFQKNRGYS